MFVPAVAQLERRLKMNNNVSVKIAVAETSVIIRSGLTTVLKRLPNLNVVPIEVFFPRVFAKLHTLAYTRYTDCQPYFWWLV